jgi:hypothetical protein
MAENNQNQDTCESVSGQGATTRRAMIRSQAKVALAIGATVLTATVAKAAPRPPCFSRGTKLRTIEGERNVEDIAVGDKLLTVFGQSREVQWVGRWQAQRRTGEPWSQDVRPVCIKQSALGPDMPYADLYVTQGHSIFIDGVLVPAGQLINGTSITLDDAEGIDELEYFHVKLATHDVIFAAGVPSETLLKYPDATADSPSHAQKADGLEIDTHCAPILCNGNRSTILARARSLATPWLGPQKLDVIRARLQEQATAIGC